MTEFLEYFPAKLMMWLPDYDDPSLEFAVLAEATEVDEKCIEIAWNEGGERNERRYLRFRRADFMRAVRSVASQ